MANFQNNRNVFLVWAMAALFFTALLAFILFRHSEPSTSTAYEQKQVLSGEELTPEKQFLLAIQEKGAPLNPFRKDQNAISAGEKHFRVICSKCHRKDAAGDVGPDLTDSVWLHGSTDKEIYLVIMEGVSKNDALQEPYRGAMPAYSSMLGVTKVLEVMAWLGSKNPSWTGKPPVAP